MNGMRWKYLGGLVFAVGSLIPLAAQGQTDLNVTGNINGNQTLNVGLSSSTTNLKFQLDGGLVSTGVYGTGSIPSGATSANSSVFLWYPAKAALWAGYTTSALSESSIGHYSIALGQNNYINGDSSVGIGLNNNTGGLSHIYMIGEGNTNISNGSSLLIGFSNQGNGGVAIGSGNQVGYGSVNIGGINNSSTAYCGYTLGYSNTAIGSFNFAGGALNTVTGTGSVALGYSTRASPGSVALGNTALTYNYNNIAIGTQVTAQGNYCAAIGYNLVTSSYNSVAFGRYNVGSGNGGTWVATDPLLEVGNGTDATHLADAFIVYKNGSAALQGPMQVASGGDIPMYPGY